PALQQWSFGPEEARRVRQPVLAVVGEESDARFHQRHTLLLEWLPDVEPFVLAGAGHLLHLQNPGDMADGLVAFFARHPIAERCSIPHRGVQLCTLRFTAALLVAAVVWSPGASARRGPGPTASPSDVCAFRLATIQALFGAANGAGLASGRLRSG